MDAQCCLADCYLDGKGVKQNSKKAVNWYRIAAGLGSSKAQYKVGYLYENGYGVQKNYAEGAKWYRKAAEQGNAEAQVRLGGMYLNGCGVAEDPVQAVKWYLKAAEQGNVEAMRKLVFCYMEGKGVKQDPSEVTKWYGKAAELGDMDAQYEYGYRLQCGLGVAADVKAGSLWLEKAEGQAYRTYILAGDEYFEGKNGKTVDYSKALYNYEKAAKYGTASKKITECQYRYAKQLEKRKGFGGYPSAEAYYLKAANSGHIEAQYAYGEYCRKTKAETTAIGWYESAARGGSVDAMNRLGECYEKGIGVALDNNKAIEYYRQAANAGNATAKERAGKMLTKEQAYQQGLEYFNGKDGKRPDYRQAEPFLKIAAENGIADAQGKYGYCLLWGWNGISTDPKTGFLWTKKAAEQGLVYALANLGLCYEKGLGVAIDAKEAVACYRRAAEKGNAVGQDGYGYCLANGFGVAKNEKEAVVWLEKAARAGRSRAQLLLGKQYENGRGVAKNIKNAAYWYGQAAKNGNVEAQRRIGLCYYKGLGVEKNYNNAVIWFQKAHYKDTIAGYMLACCYEKGLGIERDPVRACNIMCSVAYDGYVHAQEKMGEYYETGVGCQVNLSEAKRWYSLAAKQNNENAQAGLQRVQEKMAANEKMRQREEDRRQLETISLQLEKTERQLKELKEEEERIKREKDREEDRHFYHTKTEVHPTGCSSVYSYMGQDVVDIHYTATFYYETKSGRKKEKSASGTVNWVPVYRAGNFSASEVESLHSSLTGDFYD